MKPIICSLISLFIMFLSLYEVKAQENNSFFFANTEVSPSDSNKLFLSIKNTNFLKNNEYFNEIVDGYTYIGVFLQPTLIYYPTSKTKVEAGVHLLKYSGKDKISQVLPVFSFSYRPFNSITFILGTLSGTINHDLIEPLFQFEHYYNNNVENGLQLLVNTKYFRSDSWLHWENFIMPGDDMKEQFSFGTNANVYLTDPNGKNSLYLPLQLLMFHRGGQYKDDTVPLQTIENSATGIAFEHHFDGRFFKSAGTRNYFCTYNDLSHISQYKYTQGWGESSNIFLETKYANLILGYFYGEYFIAPEGEPLFASNSLKYNYYDAYRNLLTGKLQLQHEISKGIDIGLRFEYYYEFAKKDFDFSYGINLIFNRDFFIAKIK